MKDAQNGPNYEKRTQKRVTARKRRRAERRDPESAPTKNRYRGYTN